MKSLIAHTFVKEYKPLLQHSRFRELYSTFLMNMEIICHPDEIASIFLKWRWEVFAKDFVKSLLLASTIEGSCLRHLQNVQMRWVWSFLRKESETFGQCTRDQSRSESQLTGLRT